MTQHPFAQPDNGPYSQPAPDADALCQQHWQKLPCMFTGCPNGVTVPPQGQAPQEEAYVAPWTLIGWTQKQWNAFVVSAATDMHLYGGSMKTAEVVAETFGPNEESNPLWKAKQAFINERNECIAQLKEDEGFKQREADENARRRDKAQDTIRREKLERRFSGELDDRGRMHLDKIAGGLMGADQLDGLEDPEPIIDGWLYRDSINWLAGPSGTYKSFIAHDLAARYGRADMSYHGIPMGTGRVLYVVAEGGAMFKHRKAAWESHNGPVGPNVDYYLAPVQLGDFDAQVPALAQLAKDRNYDMVIIDTQAMCSVGQDENTAEGMGIIVAAAHTLREAMEGGCVLLVHHFGKDKNSGMRGNSALYAAANTVMITKRDGEHVKLSTKSADGGKQKDDEERDDLKFKLERYEPAEGQGRPSLYPLRDDAWAPKENRPPLPQLDQERLDMLKRICFHEEIGGLTSTGIREFLNEAWPKDGGNGKAYTTSGAESRAKQLVTAKLVEKKGPKWVPTDLGREVAGTTLGDGDSDD